MQATKRALERSPRSLGATSAIFMLSLALIALVRQICTTFFLGAVVVILAVSSLVSLVAYSLDLQFWFVFSCNKKITIVVVAAAATDVVVVATAAAAAAAAAFVIAADRCYEEKEEYTGRDKQKITGKKKNIMKTCLSFSVLPGILGVGQFFLALTAGFFAVFHIYSYAFRTCRSSLSLK